MIKKLKIQQAIVSQHLAILRKNRIIIGKREGTKICYSLIDENIRKMLNNLIAK